MKQARRSLIFFLAGTLSGLSMSVAAQNRPLRRIAFLNPGEPAYRSPNFAPFLNALREAGYSDGRDFSFVERAAAGRMDALGALAAELVAFNPAVMLTYSTAGVAAAAAADPSIPIVFLSAGDPIGSGFVESYRRPGGRITGIASAAAGNTTFGLDGKLLEIIRETLPQARRVGAVMHSADPTYRAYLSRLQSAASSLGFSLSTLDVRGAEHFEGAFRRAATQKLDAVLIPDQSLFDTYASQVAELAVRFRVPTFAIFPDPGVGGILATLQTDEAEILRRAGHLVARILKGERPADIAIDQPERFYLTVNRKAAATLGIKLPPAVLLRADRIIE